MISSLTAINLINLCCPQAEAHIQTDKEKRDWGERANSKEQSQYKRKKKNEERKK
jgi:hypothetical protein